MQESKTGAMYVLISAFCFAGATIFAKYATRTGEATAMHVTMARFIIGLAITVPMIVREPSLLIPRAPLWVALRAVTNVAAVFLFFYGIQHTSISKANLLNMTYPIFVFSVSPFITRERARPITVAILVATMFGVWSVVRPATVSSLSTIALGDALAFSSAIAAGFSIAILRRARRTDSSRTIVFYVMALGALINLGFLIGSPLPPLRYALIASVGGFFGAVGQLTLTFGFAHVSAQTGSLLSTIRIPVAVFLGVILFSDSFGPQTIVGAVLIISCIIAASISERAKV